MFIDINLQTQRKQNGSSIDTYNIYKGKHSPQFKETLHLPNPTINGVPQVPKTPLINVENYPNGHDALNYIMVDDLAQSLTAMSMLDVLQNHPT